METDDFKSIDGYLGSLSPAELEALEINVRQLVQHPGWQAVCAMLRVEREKHVRLFAAMVLDHPTYAHKGGLVKGLVGGETAVAKVLHKADRLRAARPADETGTGDTT